MEKACKRKKDQHASGERWEASFFHGGHVAVAEFAQIIVGIGILAVGVAIGLCYLARLSSGSQLDHQTMCLQTCEEIAIFSHV